MLSRNVNALCNFYVIYKLREVFTAIKMSIITEASELIRCQEGSNFENAIKTCSLKILESKSTLVRNCTPCMGAQSAS